MCVSGSYDGNVVRKRYRVRDRLALQHDCFFQAAWSQKIGISLENKAERQTHVRVSLRENLSESPIDISATKVYCCE